MAHVPWTWIVKKMQTLVAVKSQHASAVGLRGVFRESSHRTVSRYSASKLFFFWDRRGWMKSLKVCYQETKALCSKRFAICYAHALRRLPTLGMWRHLQMRSKLVWR